MSSSFNIPIIVSKIAYLAPLISLFVLHLSTANAQQISTDSMALSTDSNLSNNALEEVVVSYAEDSIAYDLINKKIYLYHNAKVTYGDIILESAYIELDSDKNTVFATGLKDSSGQMYGLPVFQENGKSFTAKAITYNFKSEKGIIKKVVTKEGEGYILGEKVKKQHNDVIHTHSGRYTTCDAQEPHFAIRARKIKTIPGEKIITGPANLEIASIPTPLFIPFGFFPNQQKQSSGIIFPTYGESTNKGFFLRNGGYYFVINDYMDLSLRGDIYTKGSWKLGAASNYKKRYKFNGNFNVSYASQKSGNRDLDNFIDIRDFFINWKHNQDPKANPSSRFSANVNAGSSSYHQNNSFNSNDYLKNTYSSNVSYSKTWKASNLSINLRHSQNTLNKTVNLSLPELNYNINRFQPFKGLNQSSKSKWYDNISLSYSVNAKNEIRTIDTLLFNRESLQDFSNGLKHSIPVSASFKFLKHITVSPRFNYTERWYFNYINKSWNGEELNTDTLNSFKRAYNYNFSTSLNTKLYGMIQMKKGPIRAFRHVATPSISFNYTPDFSHNRFRFYQEVQSDSLGNTQTYSIFQNGIYGSPGKVKSGNISFNLSNLIEAKVPTKNDSLNSLKKVKILESFGVSTAYNVFADSMNLSNITLSGRTKLFNILNLNFGARYDPYSLNEDGQRINRLYFSEHHKPGRLTAANATASFSLRSLANKEDNVDYSPYWDYIDFDIPWNVNVDYTFRYTKPFYEKTINQSLGFNGNIKLTDKWKIGFRSGYDFIEKNLTHTSIDIYRDLHCWEMLFKWIPFGYHQSYNFTIRVKASTLKDLKWEKKKDWYDY